MKKNIAVVGGGDSSEYVISVKSAAQIADMMIDKDKYDVYVISLTQKEWKVVGGAFDGVQIDRSDFSIPSDKGKIIFDCAYITIHGTPGENGVLPAYFDLIGLPHTTCDVLPSALTFDKHYCKLYLKNYEIPMAEEVLVKSGEDIDADAIVNKLGLPVFIKPSNGGSSFGVTKVTSREGLKEAVELAFTEDDNDVLIEEFLEGTEVTCGMVTTLDEEILLPLTEIVSENDFFDYQAKYEGASQEITPARVSDEITKECQEVTRTVNQLLNCRGITRTDYIIKNDKCYFIEINTVPGMSAASIVPQQVEANNMTMTEIMTKVIEDAIKRSK
jgi:D-alanine-D-alanine ligase